MDAYISTLSIGSTLQNGKYEIVKVLGQGGFGITYLVKHKLLDTYVAIKEFFPDSYCFRQDSTSRVTIISQTNVGFVDKLRQRFLSEARNIAKLNHPNIIRIQDIFEENSTAYYVMDLIEGESLESVIMRDGPMPESEAVRLTTKVGEAIEYIHQKKMAHYDIKPANIMIRSLDSTPVLIDFGLSKQFNEEGCPKSTVLMGVSRGFSPFEQYSEDGIIGFSPQSDVYALAATLYYLLTGKVPPEAMKLIGHTIEVPVNISPEVTNAIKWAMQPMIEDRCPDVATFLRQINSGKTIISGHRTLQYEQLYNSGAKIPSQIPTENQTEIHRDSELTTKSKQNKSEMWIYIVIAGIILFCLILVGLSNKSCTSTKEMPDTIAPPELDYYEDLSDESVGEYDEPAVEANISLSSSTNNILNGDINGYPITMQISFPNGIYNGARVEGKYAYLSTLEKYGDTPRHWFYIKGNIYEDGNINWTETTPSNSDYYADFNGYYNNGKLSGTFNEDRDDAETGYLTAYIE